MKTLLLLLLSGGLLFSFISGDSSTPDDENTNALSEYSWMVGHWKGDGFGGISEEVWTEPVDGTMMGMYRHYKDGKIVFYEFLLIDEEGLKLKHFNPDLTGWETKDKFVTFKAKGHSENKVEFSGLTFEKISDSQMEIRLKLNRSGEISTEVFTMHKVE